MKAQNDKIELRCPRCGHVWRTRSKLVFVTCPSCFTKVRAREIERGGQNEAGK